MKKVLFCLGLLAIMLININANATEIAIVNFENILSNSTAMSKVNKTLEAKKADIEKKLKADEKKLMDEKSTIEDQIKTLSQNAAQTKVEEFQSKVLDFQKNVRSSENELQKYQMDAVMQITEAIRNIIEEMRTEKNSKYNFDVVLPSASVVYSNKNIDITAEVLARLNKKVKEIKLDIK